MPAELPERVHLQRASVHVQQDQRELHPRPEPGKLPESELLSLVSVKGLTRKHRILITLFKLRLYTPAMLLCADKVSQQRRQDEGK